MSDVYKVAIAMTLQNGVSPMLGVIGRDLLGLHSKIKGIEEGFGGWATRLKGVVGVLAGGAILGGLTKIAEHGEKLLDQQDKLQRAGLDYAEVLRLQGSYKTRSRRPSRRRPPRNI